jgi:O-antigen/teichoic acid export membrane protein
MFRDGYALVVAAGATSIFGFAFWAVAARCFPSDVVGVGSAVISSMMLLAGFSQVGLTNVLVRFLPGAGDRAGALVRSSYLLGTALAGLLAVGFLAGIDLWAPSLHFLVSSVWWALAFVGGAVVFNLFALQDSAMTGLGRAVWVPVENAAYSVVKLALVLALSAWQTPEALFLAWTVPGALSIPPVSVYVVGTVRRFVAASGPPDASMDRRAIGRFVAGNGLGAMFFLIATSTLPLLVLERLGADEAAYFTPAWAIATALQLATAGFVASLTVQGARDPGSLHELIVRSGRQTITLLWPISAVILVGAPWILRLFGSDYALGADGLLRWVALSMVPHVAFSIGLAICRVLEQSSRVAESYGVVCVTTLGLSIVLMPSLGLTGIGIAWCAGQALGAFYVVLPNWWLVRPDRS